MPFKLKEQAFSWFKYIDREPPLNTQFDLYYLCLLIGLISGKSDSPGQSQDFVGHFVDGYYPYRRIIAGLLLHTELKHFGIALSESDEIKQKIELLLNSSDNMLTKDGFDKLNSYASGGFNIICAVIIDKPRNTAEFLLQYSNLLKSEMSKSTIWK